MTATVTIPRKRQKLDHEKPIRTGEACRYIGHLFRSKPWSQRRLLYAVERGEVPAVKLGSGVHYFWKSELDRWFAELRQQAAFRGPPTPAA